MNTKADDKQVGGDHYKKGGAFQHWNWALSHGLGYLESASTKYVTRWRDKGGMVDLEKGSHYLAKLFEMAMAGTATPVQTHHSVGVNPNPILMEHYAAANNLGHRERLFCEAIVNWNYTGDILYLSRASGALDDLIRAEKSNGRIG